MLFTMQIDLTANQCNLYSKVSVRCTEQSEGLWAHLYPLDPPHQWDGMQEYSSGREMQGRLFLPKRYWGLVEFNLYRVGLGDFTLMWSNSWSQPVLGTSGSTQYLWISAGMLWMRNGQIMVFHFGNTCFLRFLIFLAGHCFWLLLGKTGHPSQASSPSLSSALSEAGVDRGLNPHSESVSPIAVKWSHTWIIAQFMLQLLCASDNLTKELSWSL